MSHYLTGALAVMTIKVPNLFRYPYSIAKFFCCIFGTVTSLSVCLPVFSPLLLQEEVKELCPVPVALSCCNEMGQFVSMADLLVSKGLALRERKARSVILKGDTYVDYQNLVLAGY